MRKSSRSDELGTPPTRRQRTQHGEDDPPTIGPDMHEDKHIIDSLHGMIALEPLLVKVVDTPHFQRLRHLKQLGNASRVWPTATHCRFTHSLGVAHLAEKLCRRLKEAKLPDGVEPPSDRDILCVKLRSVSRHPVPAPPTTRSVSERSRATRTRRCRSGC